jgi:N-acetylglucosaminyldiphosphoundecaprenol N-acetyl-beta-D-mannosaminyltransferase
MPSNEGSQEDPVIESPVHDMPTMPVAVPGAASERRTYDVLGCRIDAISSDEAVARMASWAARRESRMVGICNAHVTVTTSRDSAFHAALAVADMVTPDGAPVAWMLRRLGARAQQRVSGPDLMLDYCAHAASIGEPMYFYGATDEILDALEARLRERFPGLVVAGRWSPPFRPLTREEDEAAVQRINASGARVVWVGLGCPKQELWMAEHRGRVQAVMVGVGAAFAFHAGVSKRAPLWMRERGLEWLHRLWSEPRRLWRRYLVTNTLFVLGAARQLIGNRRA